MSVDKSGGKDGKWCFVLVPCLLVLAKLIVCSTRGFACILVKWFWPTVMRPRVISELTHTLGGEVLA